MKTSFPQNGQRWLMYLVAFFIGIGFGAAYLRDYFWKSPNEGYVFYGDIYQHVAGANYFQQQPWQFPVFDFDNFRYPEGGSLIFTDGIPVVGFWVKLLYPLHGHLVDYFGWYLLLCYGLQSLAFVLLSRELGVRHWLGVVTGSLLAVATPILLHRYGHVALCSHFLILIALILYFRRHRLPDEKGWFLKFYLLLVWSLLTHPYLFLMVGFIFAAACLDALFNGAIRFFRLALYSGLAFAGLFVVMLVAGHIRLDVELGRLDGFGYYSMNLLSPFWPQLSGIPWWPTPVINATGGQYEGYAWLGFGAWWLVIVAAIHARGNLLRLVRKHLPLCAILIILTLLAISHVVYLGPYRLVTFPLSDALLNALLIFRVSGRFFWLLLYLVTIFAFIYTWKHYRRPVAVLLIMAGILLQLWDVSYRFIRDPKGMEPGEERKAETQAYEDLFREHEKIVLLPVWNHGSAGNQKLLLNLYLIASKQNKPISSNYLARSWNPRTPQEDLDLYLKDGLEEGILYLFLEPRFGLSEATLVDPEGAFTRRHDDLYLVSKDIAQLEERYPDLKRFFFPVKLPDYRLGEVLNMREGDAEPYLLMGFESGGGWTVGNTAVVRLPLDRKIEDARFHALVFPYVNERHPRQHVRVFQGETLVAEKPFQLTEPRSLVWQFSVDSEQINAKGQVLLRFEFPDAASPASLELSGDERQLGLYFERIHLSANGALPWGETAGFGLGESGAAFLLSGFSDSEETGTWTDGSEAVLHIPVTEAGLGDPVEVRIAASPFVNSFNEDIGVRVFDSEGQVGAYHLAAGEVILPIQVHTYAVGGNGSIHLRFVFDDATSPKSVGMNSDPRELGLFFQSLSIYPGEEP